MTRWLAAVAASYALGTLAAHVLFRRTLKEH